MNPVINECHSLKHVINIIASIKNALKICRGIWMSGHSEHGESADTPECGEHSH